MVQSSASLPVIASVTTPPTSAICPYLLAPEGRWRAASPAKEHRCTAVAPAAVLAIDKQRRLCLAGTHGACATFSAASAEEAFGDAQVDGSASSSRRPPRDAARPVPRTAPLVLDHGRLTLSVRSIRRDRTVAQAALLVLMVVAFVAIIVARVSTPGPVGGVLAGGSGPTRAPAAAGATPSATDANTPAAPASPTPAATAPSESGDVTAPTGPADPPATYKVRRGDTLSGIAAEFGTTVAAITELNGIDDPSRLRVGQVIELP